MITVGNYDFELDLDTRNTMSLINGWIEEHSTVLEFGSANGRLTRYLHEKKHCSVTIVEIDEDSGKEAAEYAEESYVGPKQGDIGQYYWAKTEKKYDSIIFADVLEHLSNPREVLLKCLSVLKDTGKILVSIPNVAHNSILIDLFNDKFIYDKTGLLDQTHIHFFTNTTFREMLKNTGLYIYRTEPIYSRVGNNEIANTYEDVSIEVSTALRKRLPGSIYQYVYMLGQNPSKENLQVRYEPIDQYEDQETTCFWENPISHKIKRENSISRIYDGKETETIEFDVSSEEISKVIRWDPMEHNCIIAVEDGYTEFQDGSKRKLKFIRSNADLQLGSWYLFKSSDPMLFYEIEEFKEKVQKIVFSFRIWKHSFLLKENDGQLLRELKRVEEEAQKEKEKKDAQTETIKQLYKDVEHRERDITELKEAIEMFNQKIAQLNARIETQKQEISEQKEKISGQEQKIEQQENEIARQGEIIELQTYKIETYQHPLRNAYKKVREGWRRE